MVTLLIYQRVWCTTLPHVFGHRSNWNRNAFTEVMLISEIICSGDEALKMLSKVLLWRRNGRGGEGGSTVENIPLCNTFCSARLFPLLAPLNTDIQQNWLPRYSMEKECVAHHEEGMFCADPPGSRILKPEHFGSTFFFSILLAFQACYS